MIDIKYCKKCEEAFDIDTEKELCPTCRNPGIKIEIQTKLK